MSVKIAHYPIESQFDGSPNWANDCGETCVSAGLKYTKNLSVPPDQIRRTILGQRGLGYSYFWQLEDYLTGYGVECQFLNWHYWQDAITYMRNVALPQQQPCILLLYADRANLTGGHFVTGVGIEDTNAEDDMNPWGGIIETLPYGQFARIYQGGLLHLMHGPYVAPHPQPTGTNRVTVPQWLRAKPRADSAMVTLVEPGDLFTQLDFTPNWRLARMTSGKSAGKAGWIMAIHEEKV